MEVGDEIRRQKLRVSIEQKGFQCLPVFMTMSLVAKSLESETKIVVQFGQLPYVLVPPVW